MCAEIGSIQKFFALVGRRSKGKCPSYYLRIKHKLEHRQRPTYPGMFLATFPLTKILTDGSPPVRDAAEVRLEPAMNQALVLSSSPL